MPVHRRKWEGTRKAWLEVRPLERRPGWCVGEQYSAVVPVGNALEMQSTYSRAGRGQHCAVFAAASAHGGWCVWGAAIPQVQNCTSDAKNDICSLNSLYLSTYRIWTHTYLCISIDIYRYIHREKCIYQYLIPPISLQNVARSSYIKSLQRPVLHPSPPLLPIGSRDA